MQTVQMGDSTSSSPSGVGVGCAPSPLLLPGEDPQAQAAQGPRVMSPVWLRVWGPGCYREDRGIVFYFEYILKSVKLFLNDRLYYHRGNSSGFLTAGYYLLVGTKSVK